jgi:sulfite exporter TauE/SafE
MMIEQVSPSTERKLTVVEQIVCALPIALVAVGGAIGGACGGVAWAVNQKIMRSDRSAPVRYLLIALTFVGAVLAYFAVLFALALAFPDLFERQ